MERCWEVRGEAGEEGGRVVAPATPREYARNNGGPVQPDQHCPRAQWHFKMTAFGLPRTVPAGETGVRRRGDRLHSFSLFSLSLSLCVTEPGLSSSLIVRESRHEEEIPRFFPASRGNCVPVPPWNKKRSLSLQKEPFAKFRWKFYANDNRMARVQVFFGSWIKNTSRFTNKRSCVPSVTPFTLRLACVFLRARRAETGNDPRFCPDEFCRACVLWRSCKLSDGNGERFPWKVTPGLLAGESGDG